MNVFFASSAWRDYQRWLETDPKTFKRINLLLKDVLRSPYAGIGKPEALKYELSGYWSRRIDREHRLVYRVHGIGPEQVVQVLSCRLHYPDNG